MTRPRESWLRSEDHERFVRAIDCCLHPEAWCLVVGQCQYGGCFPGRRAADPALERRVQRLEDQVRAMRRALAQERAMRRARVAAREGRA